MANFQVTVTKKGLALLAAGMEGGSVRFTRMVMGESGYSGELSAVGKVIGPKKSLSIRGISRKDSQVTLRSILSFQEVEEGFDWKEIGLYADGGSGEEILYAYGNAGEKGDYIPGSKEATLNERIIQITVSVGNAANVTAQISGSGVFVEREEMESAIEELGVVVLTHRKEGNCHRFSGLNGREGLLLARFSAAGRFSDGDRAEIDGESYQMLTQTGEEPEDGFFTAGAGVEMVVDTGKKTVNFKSGGGLGKRKLALADADEDSVFSGRTFYAGGKELRTGRALLRPATAGAQDIASGKTAYNQLGELLTGTGRAVLAGSLQPPLQERTYTIPYNNTLGKPKAILCYFNVWIVDYAASGRHPSFSPYFFRGAASGQLMGMTSAAGGTMLNQNQTAANTTISVGSDSFSVTISKYDYVSGCEFDYLLVW